MYSQTGFLYRVTGVYYALIYPGTDVMRMYNESPPKAKHLTEQTIVFRQRKNIFPGVDDFTLNLVFQIFQGAWGRLWEIFTLVFRSTAGPTWPS